MNKIRLNYLDNSKGLAIILMLYGHTDNVYDWTNVSIYAFHMPIFFIIGGILIGLQASKQNIKLSTFFAKKFQQLIIPYLIFSLLYTIFFSLLSFVSGGSISLHQKFIECLTKTFTFAGLASLWFIPTYFISICLLKLTSKNIITHIIILIILTTTFFSRSNENDILQRITISWIFTIIGYILYYYDIINKMTVTYSILLLTIGGTLAISNGHVSIEENLYHNPYIFIIGATCLSIAILVLFNNIKNLSNKRTFQILSYLGKNSIVLLLINNFFVEIIYLISYKVFGITDLQYELLYLKRIVFTIIMLVLSIPFFKLSETKQFGFIFGKKK